MSKLLNLCNAFYVNMIQFSALTIWQFDLNNPSALFPATVTFPKLMSCWCWYKRGEGSTNEISACWTRGKMSSRLHVRSVLNSIDNISKLFFLSPFKSVYDLKVPPQWKSFTFWNMWTLAGFVIHSCFHLIYVLQNDNSGARPKLVTVFIDIYNKYCGLLLSGILVLTGYFKQTSIAKINLMFEEIEDVFLQQMKIKINNFNTLRWDLMRPCACYLRFLWFHVVP